MANTIPQADERGEFVKRLRNRRQLTQSKLAKAVGVSLNAIQQIESGNRTGRGMHPENATRLLIELAKREPFEPQEIEDFARLFQMERDYVIHLLRRATAPQTLAPVSPEGSSAVQGMLGSLVRDLGESQAVELITVITNAVNTAATKARNAAIDWARSQVESEPARRAVVSERSESGMTIEERRHYNAQGQPLVPVPAGEGVVDDPFLLIEAELNAFSAAREAGNPPPKVSEHTQKILDILKAVPKTDRRSNSA